MLRPDLESDRQPLSTLYGDALIRRVRRPSAQTLPRALDPQWAYVLSAPQERAADGFERLLWKIIFKHTSSCSTAGRAPAKRAFSWRSRTTSAGIPG